MNLKEEKTQVLWNLIGEISKMLAERELVPASERTGLYKETSDALTGIMNALLEEINQRKPDSATA